jgi:hypothetical protein
VADVLTIEYSNLKRAEATVEGDQEVVKRSGKDEQIWVEIHICMEITQGIFLITFLKMKKESMRLDRSKLE